MAKSKQVVQILVPVVVKRGQEFQHEPELIPHFCDYKFGMRPAEELIDIIAPANAYKTALDGWVKAAKEALKPKLPPVSVGSAYDIEGTRYILNYQGSSRRFLSEEKLIAKFGEEALQDCYVETDPFGVMRFTVKP